MNICRHGIRKKSGEIARARTELTIASDRMDCGPEELTQMRKEIVNILAKYLNLEENAFKIRLDIVHEINQGVQDVKTIQIK